MSCQQACTISGTNNRQTFCLLYDHGSLSGTTPRLSDHVSGVFTSRPLRYRQQCLHVALFPCGLPGVTTFSNVCILINIQKHHRDCLIVNLQFSSESLSMTITTACPAILHTHCFSSHSLRLLGRGWVRGGVSIHDATNCFSIHDATNRFSIHDV